MSIDRCNRCIHRAHCALGAFGQWVEPAPDGPSRLSGGQHVFRQGEQFTALYAVHAGAVKTYELSRQGSEHITGFHLPGDVIGLDGLNDQRHRLSAVSLQGAALCELDERGLLTAMQESPGLCGELLSLMSAAMHDEHQRARLMQRIRADERLVAFLVQLSDRYAKRQLSRSRIRLPMTRTDIAGYLGLTLESVSRAFRRLIDQQRISVEGRELVLDAAILSQTTDRDDGAIQFSG